MDVSAAVTAKIEEDASELEKFYDRITSCRVMVEAPHRHHLRGEAFHVRIELGVPGTELVVNHEPAFRSDARHGGDEGNHKAGDVEGAHKDVYVAVRDAFAAMRRQLKEYARCQRGDVKTHRKGES
jgi:ribosome-associated translation inhibitor RaiA